MFLPVLIVIKQHSLISRETKVCLLGSPCTCDNVFSIRQRYHDSPRPKTWTATGLQTEPNGRYGTTETVTVYGTTVERQR